MTRQQEHPRFSIVTAVYNVEPYLPDFIASVESQRVAREDLEIVAVDDGSTDGSLDLLREWARRSRFSVKVYTKPNGGQASARNLGLIHATGEWVTFPDPDDMLDPGYLAAADRFARSHPEVAVMTARPIVLSEAAAAFTAKHPRAWQYAEGNRVADLATEPNAFLATGAGSFFRLDPITALGLRQDTRVRPHFEDWHFAVRYLLALPAQVIGIVSDALYIYRKRADGTSVLQQGVRHPGRYSDVLEFGYLDVLQRSRTPSGWPAAWVQQLIVYELSWYLSEDEKAGSGVSLDPERMEQFHSLLAQILALLDPDIVAGHGVRRLRSTWIDVLSHAARPEQWHGTYLVRTREDRDMGLQRVNYRFVGDPPVEQFTDDGRPIAPAFAKTMAHRWYGRALLYERIVWLPTGDRIQVSIDGTAAPILGEWPSNPAGRPRRTLRLRLWLIRRNPRARLVRSIGRRMPWRSVSRVLRRLRSRLIQGAARSAWARRRFGKGWVLMDRIHDAGDSGERLFEYLRSVRPDVNAWFVMERGTPDWERLRRAWGGRIVAHGSLDWKLLMLNGAWLISSHADMAVLRPPKLAGLRRAAAMKVAFVQHGITKDDLSQWMNQRELDFVAVGTAAELQSMTADGSTYRLTTKEVRNTGLPRFDRLLSEGRGKPVELRDLILVTPTWRNTLAVPMARDSQRRSVNDAFWGSEYVRNWGAFLRSPHIAAAVERRGLRLGFMPHPNFQSVLSQFELPAHVVALTFAGADVQALFARCALLVTDYSSVAFDVAYLDRPVVYFQFDQAEMFGGSHVWRRGYFDYERHGFGPVADDLATAERAVVAAIERGPRPAAEYQKRIDATFPVRDGHACARVVAAIEELSRPYEPPAA